jgi:hypothetical protein
MQHAGSHESRRDSFIIFNILTAEWIRRKWFRVEERKDSEIILKSDLDGDLILFPSGVS